MSHALSAEDLSDKKCHVETSMINSEIHVTISNILMRFAHIVPSL